MAQAHPALFIPEREGLANHEVNSLTTASEHGDETHDFCGVELVQGVIVPPQVALVGIGTVVQRPWAVGDAVAVRPVVTVTFSGDHRAGDGHLGARFLSTLDELLQRPEDL